MIINVSLLNRNFMIVVILLRNIRVDNQIINVVKVMTRLIFNRKTSDTVDIRFDAGNDSRESRERMINPKGGMLIAKYLVAVDLDRKKVHVKHCF